MLKDLNLILQSAVIIVLLVVALIVKVNYLILLALALVAYVVIKRLRAEL